MTPVARALAITGLVVALALSALLIGGYNVVVQSREQAQYNASLLRIIVTVTGCKPDDDPQQCADHLATASAAEGKQRVLEVECRIRMAIAQLPAPPPELPCVLTR